jgi:hypothetical protein
MLLRKLHLQWNLWFVRYLCQNLFHLKLHQKIPLL